MTRKTSLTRKTRMTRKIPQSRAPEKYPHSRSPQYRAPWRDRRSLYGSSSASDKLMREMHAWLASASHGGGKITPILQREFDHGEYKDAWKKLSHSISSVLIVGVKLRHPVAMLPPEIVVMVLHFHYVAAKGAGGLCAARDRMLKEISELIKQNKVNIFITDANMAMLQVVDAVRSSGLLIDVAAWLPWLTEEGQRGMDSMFIAFIGAPGEHKIVTKD